VAVGKLGDLLPGVAPKRRLLRPVARHTETLTPYTIKRKAEHQDVSCAGQEECVNTRDKPQ